MPRIKLAVPEKFEFSTEIVVRITDINYGGHLGNDSILSIIHEARVRYLRNLGFSEKDIDSIGIIMADSVIIYKSEGFYGDILNVEVCVENIDTFGFDFFYKLTNTKSGKEIAASKTGMVFYDYHKKKIAKSPEIFKKKISEIKNRV
jgi:acyl-CoA thioester hydrolase